MDFEVSSGTIRLTLATSSTTFEPVFLPAGTGPRAVSDGGPEAPRRMHPARRLLRRAFWLVAIAFLIRTFFGEVALVPTSSMEGTILAGDHILLNKLLYGPQIPFTKIRLPHLKNVARGNIV